MFCTVHVQCTHSARYSARHSARPQNAVNTTSFPKNNQKTQKKENISIVFCKLSTKRQSHGIYSVLWPCTVWHALYRALCVHCTCTVQNTVCAILLLEAWRHILCLWVAAVKMNVSLDWGCGTCKREFVQACACTAINKKILCFFVCWVAALKMRACLD